MHALIGSSIALALFFVGLVGYAMNFIKLVATFDVLSASEAILRVGGVIIPILGAIFGYF